MSAFDDTFAQATVQPFLEEFGDICTYTPGGTTPGTPRSIYAVWNPETYQEIDTDEVHSRFEFEVEISGLDDTTGVINPIEWIFNAGGAGDVIRFSGGLPNKVINVDLYVMKVLSACRGGMHRLRVSNRRTRRQ